VTGDQEQRAASVVDDRDGQRSLQLLREGHRVCRIEEPDDAAFTDGRIEEPDLPATAKIHFANGFGHRVIQVQLALHPRKLARDIDGLSAQRCLFGRDSNLLARNQGDPPCLARDANHAFAHGDRDLGRIDALHGECRS